MVVSYLTYQNQTTESWKIVFIITGTLLICGGIIYIIFADSSEQAWSNGKIRNSHKKRENELSEEMKELNNKNSSSVREIL
jgi:hypothetical protein